MKELFSNKIIRIAIVVAILVAVGYSIVTSVSFNFSLLAIGLFITFLLICWLSSIRNRMTKLHLGAVFFSFFAFVSLWTLNNYFKAEGEVYSNSDHHAVKIEGVKIVNPENFIIAGNSEEAFFDKEGLNGTLSISKFGEKELHLKATGFSQPLYKETHNKGKRVTGLKLYNERSVVRFSPRDTLNFITRAGRSYKFYIDETTTVERENLGMRRVARDTSHYYIKSADTTFCSMEKRFISKALPMNTILSGIALPDLDFSGINLLRDSVFTENEGMMDNFKELFYKKSPKVMIDSRGIGYVLEIGSPVFERGQLREVIVCYQDGNRKRYPMQSLRSSVENEIIVDYGTVISVGILDDTKTLPVRFEKGEDGESVVMKYMMPRYHYLSSVNKIGSNTIYITSDLTKIINDNPPENIMLFDLFSTPENKNHLKQDLYLSYVSGPTTQDMKFALEGLGPNVQYIKSGTTIGGITSKNGNLEYLMSIEDFKSTTCFGETRIMLFLGLLYILLLGLYFYGSAFVVEDQDGRRWREYFFSSLELIAYMIIFFMVTLRMFLLWRTSVFPPVEGVTLYEFTHFFRDINMMSYLFIGLNIIGSVVYAVKYMRKVTVRQIAIGWQHILMLFVKAAVANIVIFSLEMSIFDLGLSYLMFAVPFVTIAVALLFLYEDIWAGWFGKSENRGWKRFVFNSYFAIVLLYLAAYLVGRTILGSFGILIVVLTYFVVEFFIYKFSSEDYIGAEGREKVDSMGFVELFGSNLFKSLFNSMVAAVSLVFMDSGYGILFITYALFAFLIKLHDYYDAHLVKSRSRGFAIVGLALMIVAMLVSYKWIFIGYQQGAGVTPYIATIVVMAIALLLVLYILYVPKEKILKAGMPAAAIIGIAVVLVVNGALTRHTAQRVNVHIYDNPADGLEQITSARDQQRYFEASLNDYILYTYNDLGERVNSVGERGAGYFKMQPHSKLGAMWGAQSSDILLARFIVAEHNKNLPIALVVIFLIMFIAGFAMNVRHRVAKMMLVQIPLLLFIHILMVWMANTQRFIFLGQDIPMLSLHSKMSICYFALLVTAWIAVAVYEKMSVLYLEDYSDDCGLERLKVNFWSRCLYIGGAAAIGVIILNLFVGGAKNKYKDNRYDLKKLLEETDKYVERINRNYFTVDFQNEYKRNLSKVGRSAGIADMVKALDEKNSDQIMAELGGDTSFHYRLWKNFVSTGVKSNESGAVLHVRKHNKYKIEDGKETKIDSFAVDVRVKFFNRQLPFDNSTAWRGNIVEYDKESSIQRSKVSGTIKKISLPHEWLRSGESAVLVTTKDNISITIRNNSKSHTSVQLNDGRGYNRACRVFDTDYAQDRLINDAVAHKRYIARNVMINGERNFIYPKGEKLFWARTLAKELLEQKRQAERRIKQAPEFHDDIAVSLDANLNTSIYDIFKGANPQYLTVIAANGDGAISAIVDYERRYILNPNDLKKVEKLEDKLYMEVDRDADRGYFGNRNLLKMKEGPGSSQKPIVWTTVASGIDFEWSNLTIPEYYKKSIGKGKNKHYISIPSIVSGKYAINSFAGQKFKSKHPFKALRQDENYGEGVTLSGYMTHSSNYYNGVMLYFGAFPADHYDKKFLKIGDRGNNTILRGFGNNKNLDSIEANFPIMRLDRRIFDKSVVFNTKLPSDYKVFENSLFMTRINTMFGINGEPDNYTTLFGEYLDNGNRVNGYSYAESSVLRYGIEDRAKNSIMEKVIRQTAIGAGGVWEVTPYKMAEMFGRVALLNKNFKLTLNPEGADGRGCKYEMMDDLQEEFLEARGHLLYGMNRIFTGSERGTAKSTGVVKNIVEGKRKINVVVNNDGEKFYIYGKTGTTGEGNNENHHRLGIIITDRDISILDEDDLDKVKFYVAYFTCSTNLQIATYGKAIQAIIDSDSFKKYMKEDK